MAEEQDRVIEQELVAPEDRVEQVPESEAEEEEENEVEDLSDLTRVDKEDVLGKADGNSEPDDLSDITGLDEEDIKDLFDVNLDEPEEEPKPKVRLVRRLKRTNKRYLPPPTSLGGVRG